MSIGERECPCIVKSRRAVISDSMVISVARVMKSRFSNSALAEHSSVISDPSGGLLIRSGMALFDGLNIAVPRLGRVVLVLWELPGGSSLDIWLVYTFSAFGSLLNEG
jgi:hypothetical protein